MYRGELTSLQILFLPMAGTSIDWREWLLGNGKVWLHNCPNKCGAYCGEGEKWCYEQRDDGCEVLRDGCFPSRAPCPDYIYKDKFVPPIF